MKCLTIIHATLISFIWRQKFRFWSTIEVSWKIEGNIRNQRIKTSHEHFETVFDFQRRSQFRLCEGLEPKLGSDRKFGEVFENSDLNYNFDTRSWQYHQAPGKYTTPLNNRLCPLEIIYHSILTRSRNRKIANFWNTLSVGSYHM